MNLARIQIQTTPMKLGMQTRPPVQEIEQGGPNSLQIRTQASKLEMHTEQVKVKIDQSACFEESGLKSNASLIREHADYGKHKGLEAIGKIVEQGNQFASIERGIDPIPDQAEYNAFEQFVRDWNIGFIPQSRPKIDFVGGTVNFRHEPAKVINETQKTKPHINYTRGKVDIYVAQYNKVELSVLDLKV